MTILTLERLAEIKRRVEERKGHYADRVKWAFADRIALLASHAELQVEVERLRGHLDKRNEEYLTMNSHAADLQDELTTARESAAREMRERCAEVCGMNNADLRDRINALPLTPADGAKDE